MTPMPAVLTIREAAQILRGSADSASIKLVRRLVESGAIKRCRGRKVQGGTVLIPASEIRTYAGIE